MTDVVIVGGGVSGLATAYALASSGYEVQVLERQIRTGGKAISERFDGFLMEHGPGTVNAASATAVAISEALGLDARRVDLQAEVRRRYLTHGATLHGIGIHPLAFFTSGYLSAGARLRLLREAFVRRKRGIGDESVAAFFSRRFGAEFAERVIDPMVGGMYAGTAGTSSMAAMFPQLLQMERAHGSVTAALVAAQRRGAKMPGRRLFSWQDGVGSLPQALARALGSAVRTGIAVQRIEPAGGGFSVKIAGAGSCRTPAVVIATQPHVAAGLLAGVDEDAAAAAAAIEAPPLAVVFLGYRRSQIAHPLDGLGYLTPRGEGRALTGALFCSTTFAGRAPDGHVALAGYVGGMRAPALARLGSDRLIELARAEFADLLGARGEPAVAKVRLWARGLPQYGLGHGAKVDVLERTGERVPGLFLTGNYLRGVSVAACLDQAMNTALRVQDHLRGARRDMSAVAMPSAGNDTHALGAGR